MPTRCYLDGNCAIGLLLSILVASSSAAPVSPFVAVAGGVYDGRGNPLGPELLQSNATGPLNTSVGTAPAASGLFRSAFGSNGYDIQVTGGLNRAIYGGSIWTDGVTVTGGVGTANLTLSTRIQGSVSGQVEMGYALFVSSRPFDFATILAAIGASNSFSGLQLPNASRALSSGIANRCNLTDPIGDCGSVPFQDFQGLFDVSLSTDVTQTYGETFYLASVFEGGIDTLGGTSSFFNSADFSISASPGTAVRSLSGTSYTSAVPEPPSVALTLSACLFILISQQAARRRRA